MTKVKLNQDDENILKAIGAINFDKGGKKTAPAISNMLEELEGKIEEKTKEFKEIELLNDPEKNEKVKIVYSE